MKVFLVAYGCEPNQGGEHEVGWKIATELAKKIDLTVITRKANSAQINRQNENINVVFIENELGMKIKPKGRFSYAYYFCWQWSAFSYLLKNAKPNDIVHLITFGNIHLPHFLFLLRSKLIIGPMGGGAVIDTTLINTPSFTLKIKSIIHKLINKLTKFNPLYHLLYWKCNKIILRTTDTLAIVPSFYKSKTKILLETGVDNNANKFISKTRSLKRIITTAKLLERKNTDQIIETFLILEKLNKKEEMQLDILGDGPCKEKLMVTYGHIKNIRFHGNVPHEQIKAFLSESDLFLFCSIHEGGTHSLFEAAASNLAIACYNVSGMMEFPPKNSAIKITPTKRIQNNIESLANQIWTTYNEDKINKICQNAILSLNSKFNWHSISNEFVEVYDEIDG